MIDKVVVFTGSKKDFEIFLEKQIPEDSETIRLWMVEMTINNPINTIL